MNGRVVVNHTVELTRRDKAATKEKPRENRYESKVGLENHFQI
jgi:hypothetical protein